MRLKLGSNQVNKIIQNNFSINENSSKKLEGYWRGEKITINTNDIDEKFEYIKMQLEAGIKTNQKSLTERKITLDQKFIPIDITKLNKLEKNIAKENESIKNAKKFFLQIHNRKNIPEPAAKLTTMMQQYIGLQRLANSLKGNNEKLIIEISTNGKFSSLNDLIQALQKAGDDKKTIARIFSEVEGLPQEENELFEMMKNLRYEPEKLKEKLRSSQNLPNLNSSQIDEITETIENTIREFELKEGGRIIATLNSLDSASQSESPATFIESFSDIVHGSDNFSRTLQTLLERYNPDELITIIPLMKQALVDDLSADFHSTDKIKLMSLISEISHMNISVTLIEMTKNLIKEIKRLFPKDLKENHGF